MSILKITLAAIVFTMVPGLPDAAVPRGQANITFDGFCDGLDLQIGPAIVGGTITGTSGCPVAIGFWVGGNVGIDYSILPSVIPAEIVNVAVTPVPGTDCALTYYLE